MSFEADSAQQPVLVGGATVEFCVAPGAPMAGFIARTQGATGTHDPLTARALVFARAYAVLALDVCALHEQTCQQLRTFGRNLGLADVVVHAIHTHAGPCVAHGRVGEHDPRAHAAMVAAGEQALVDALAASTPCTVAVRQEAGLQIAYDRRRGQVADVPIQSIQFLTAAGRVHAQWVTFPCHPVVLDGANTLFSADYPGVLRSQLAQRAPGAHILFTTGPAGELNTGHRATDSITKLGGAQRTFTRADEIGGVLASAVDVKHQLLPTELQPSEPVRFADQPVAIPYVSEHAGDDELPLPPWRGRVSVLRIGGAQIIFLPGEPFWEWAQPLATRSAELGLWPMLVGYSDGVPGYFPTPGAYAEGGYEVVDAHRYYGMPGPFAPTCAQILAAATAELIDSTA